MLFYYHLLHITKRLYVSHNGGCVSRARRKNGAYRRIKTQKGPPPFGRGRWNNNQSHGILLTQDALERILT